MPKRSKKPKRTKKSRGTSKGKKKTFAGRLGIKSILHLRDELEREYGKYRIVALAIEKWIHQMEDEGIKISPETVKRLGRERTRARKNYDEDELTRRFHDKFSREEAERLKSMFYELAEKARKMSREELIDTLRNILAKFHVDAERLSRTVPVRKGTGGNLRKRKKTRRVRFIELKVNGVVVRIYRVVGYTKTKRMILARGRWRRSYRDLYALGISKEDIEELKTNGPRYAYVRGTMIRRVSGLGEIVRISKRVAFVNAYEGKGRDTGPKDERYILFLSEEEKPKLYLKYLISSVYEPKESYDYANELQAFRNKGAQIEVMVEVESIVDPPYRRSIITIDFTSIPEGAYENSDPNIHDILLLWKQAINENLHGLSGYKARVWKALMTKPPHDPTVEKMVGKKVAIRPIVEAIIRPDPTRPDIDLRTKDSHEIAKHRLTVGSVVYAEKHELKAEGSRVSRNYEGNGEVGPCKVVELYEKGVENTFLIETYERIVEK